MLGRVGVKISHFFTIYLFGGKKCTYFLEKVLIMKSTYSLQFSSRNPVVMIVIRIVMIVIRIVRIVTPIVRVVTKIIRIMTRIVTRMIKIVTRMFRIVTRIVRSNCDG